jgi:hypothetical protein
MLTVAALPLNAATVVVRTGTSTGALAFEGISALAVGWTQASGASFTAGSITATVHSVIGTATGTAYLTNSLGVSASNVVASVPFSVSSLTPTTITLFSGLTLRPARTSSRLPTRASVWHGILSAAARRKVLGRA